MAAKWLLETAVPWRSRCRDPAVVVRLSARTAVGAPVSAKVDTVVLAAVGAHDAVAMVADEGDTPREVACTLVAVAALDDVGSVRGKALPVTLVQRRDDLCVKHVAAVAPGLKMGSAALACAGQRSENALAIAMRSGTSDEQVIN